MVKSEKTDYAANILQKQMNSTLITLILAAASPLAWLAYRHYDGYKKIYIGILTTFGTIIALGGVYLLGALVSLIDIGHRTISTSPTKPPNDQDFALNRLFDLKEDTVLFLIYSVPFIVFLVFLSALPKLGIQTSEAVNKKGT